MEKVRPVIKDYDSVLTVEEYHSEEALRSELELVVSLRLPGGVYPPDQGFFIWP